MFHDTCAKLYNPSEHLAAGEDTVLFKGSVIFKQNIPNNKK
jgi:hypothetical protein